VDLEAQGGPLIQHCPGAQVLHYSLDDPVNYIGCRFQRLREKRVTSEEVKCSWSLGTRSFFVGFR